MLRFAARALLIAVLAAGCTAPTPSDAPGVDDPTAAPPDPALVTQYRSAGLSLFANESSNANLLTVTPDPTDTTSLAMVSTVTIPSAASGSASARTISGLLVEPAQGSLHPGVLMLGEQADARDMLPRAVDLANVGVVSLLVDPELGQLTFTSADHDAVIRQVLDLRSALSALANRPDVDENAIGYIGLGTGATIGGLFVGVESRLEASVLQSGSGTFMDGLASSATGSPAPSLDPAARAAWTAAMQPIEPIWFVGNAPNPVLFEAGRQDTITTPVESATFGKAGNATSSFSWYDAGHGLDDAASCDAAKFLSGYLGFEGRQVTACGAAPPQSNDTLSWLAIIGLFVLMIAVRLWVRMRQRPPGPPPAPPTPQEIADEENAGRPVIRPAQPVR